MKTHQMTSLDVTLKKEADEKGISFSEALEIGLKILLQEGGIRSLTEARLKIEKLEGVIEKLNNVMSNG